MRKYTFICSGVLILLLALGGCGQNQNPTAQINVQPTALQAGMEAAFDGSRSTDTDGSIAKYEWDFGDGGKAQGAAVKHAFAQAGSYAVKLTVTDDKQASNASTRTIAVAAASLSAEQQLAQHIELSKGTSIRIPAGAEPRHLLPNATEGTWESQISVLIFDSLLQPNDTFENIPALAETYEWDEQSLTYTFHLRQGVKFHDGEAFDCDDVMFSYKAWIHPDYPGVRFSNFENIVGAQAYHNRETTDWPIPGLQCADAFTFKVQLTQVQRTFLAYSVGSSGIMPQHVYEPYLEANGYAKLQGADSDLGKTIGTGPYKLDEWVTDQYVKMVRFDGYWIGRYGRQLEVEDQLAFPGIEQLYWVVMPDTEAQYAALLANEVDVLDTRSQVDQYFNLKNNSSFATFVYPQLVYDYWHWNLRNELFQDVSVRQAMCSALDRQDLVDKVLRGLGELTNGPTSPLRWDWDETLDQVHPHYDPERVVQLMEDAGWTIEKNADGSIKSGAVWAKTTEDGRTLKMEFEIAHNVPNPRRQDFAVLMQQQLSKLGFNASIRAMETNAFYNDYLEGSHAFETAIAGWRMGTDPDGTELWHSKSMDAFNWHAYANPEVDALLEEGLQYADFDRARPIYQKINKILVETMGYCWLVFPSATFASKLDLMGMEQWSALSPFSHLTEWYWEGKGLPVTVKKP